MKNSLANRVKYALEQGNVVDLKERGLTTITSASASVPTVLNSAYMYAGKIHINAVFGQDTDEIAIAPPFDMRITGGQVACTGAVATGGIIIQKDGAEMCSEIACITNEAVVQIANVSHTEALLISDSDSLDIIGVSSSTSGVITLDFIPV